MKPRTLHDEWNDRLVRWLHSETFWMVAYGFVRGTYRTLLAVWSIWLTFTVLVYFGMSRDIASAAALGATIQLEIIASREVNGKLVDLILAGITEWRDEWRSRDY